MPKICYYCGTTLTGKKASKEHIPPQMMFTAFSGFTPITVYSCELHNGFKSDQDQAIISGFLQTLDSMVKAGTAKYTPNIRKAINDLRLGTIQSTKNTVVMTELVKGMPKLSQMPNPIDWIRQLTAGWVFDGIKDFDNSIDWANATVHSHTFFPDSFGALNNQQKREESQKTLSITANYWEKTFCHWERGWSPYPTEIYRFFVSFDDSQYVAFKHVFYSNLIWYLEFECSSPTRTQLINRIRSA